MLDCAPHNEDKGSNHSTARPLRSLPHLGCKFTVTTPSSLELWSDLIRVINFLPGLKVTRVLGIPGMDQMPSLA